MTTLAITDTFKSGEIIACDLASSPIFGQSYATTPYSGTYTGTAPATVEIQVLAADGVTVRQAYTTLLTPSIGGGTWAGNVRTGKGDDYRVQAQAKDGGGGIIATSGVTTNVWGVGRLGLQVGQSHLVEMGALSSSPPAALAQTRVFDGTTWSTPTGNGNIIMLNTAAGFETGQGLGGTNVPWGLTLTGVGGTAVTVGGDTGSGYWLNTGANPWLNPFVTVINALTNKHGSFVLAAQGSNDAEFGVLFSTLYPGEQTLRSNVNTLMAAAGASNATLPWFVLVNARTTNQPPITDADWEACIASDVTFGQTETNAYIAANLYDQPIDTGAGLGFHLFASGYGHVGYRAGQSFGKWVGQTAHDGASVKVTSGVYRGNRITLMADLNGGTQIQFNDGTTVGNGQVAWFVSSDGFATALTISATSFGTGGRIFLDLASPVPVGTQVIYCYGAGPSLTLAKLDYNGVFPGGDPSFFVPLLPIPLNAPISLTLAPGFPPALLISQMVD